MTFRSAPINSPASTASSGRGPLAVLRRAKNIKNASDPERDRLLGDAERIETWSAWLVLGAIVLEAVTWASPLCPILFKLGNFVADAAVAIGIYGEMKFGHVVGNILKIRLAEANERAAVAEKEAGRAHERAAEIERITARRHLTPEQHWQVVEAVSGFASEIDLLIEFPRNDSEAYVYAYDLAGTFSEGGVKKIRIIGNEFLSGRVFGVRLSAVKPEWLPKIEDALSEPGIPRSVISEDRDLSKHLPREQRAPNLYVFVAPKSPPEWVQPNPFILEPLTRDANSVAEEDRTKRVGIETHLLRRPADKINNREFVDKMSEFKGVTADIVGHGDAHHVIGVARLLHSTLQRVGWETTYWRNPNGSPHLSIRIVTCRGADRRTLDAANALMNALAIPELHPMHILDAAGGMIDFAKPVLMPNGVLRDASKNAPIRILVGGRPDEVWVRPVDDPG